MPSSGIWWETFGLSVMCRDDDMKNYFILLDIFSYTNFSTRTVNFRKILSINFKTGTLKYPETSVFLE